MDSRTAQTVEVVCLVEHLRRCEAVEGQTALLLVMEMTAEQCAALRGTLEDTAYAPLAQKKEQL